MNRAPSKRQALARLLDPDQLIRVMEPSFGTAKIDGFSLGGEKGKTIFYECIACRMCVTVLRCTVAGTVTCGCDKNLDPVYP